MKAMLCDPIGVKELPIFLDSTQFWGQQKVDGQRCLVYVERRGVLALNREGVRRDLPARVVKDLRNQSEVVLLDGEIIDQTFCVFDLLLHQRTDLRGRPLLQRAKLLEEFFQRHTFANVVMLPFARTVPEKKALLLHIEEQRGEGMVFKNIRSTYLEQRSRDWTKYKLWKSCDCVVTELRPKGKSSVAVGLFDGNHPVPIPVTKVKMDPGILDNINIGDVVEVKYLHLTTDNRLREPSFLRLRDDKPAAECTFAQVAIQSKAVFELPKNNNPTTT